MRCKYYGCSGLTSVTIPNSVTKIGSYAFDDCSGLEKVIVQDLAAWCGISFGTDGNYDYAYPSNPLCYAHHLYSDENTEITDLIIPDTVTSIGSYVFHGCSGLKSVTIPNSVTEIGDGAFFLCRGLTSVTIPDSVTSIGNDAFHGCSGLTSVTIPNSVTSIGDWAFYGCSGLNSVTIPNSVTSISYYAFYGCSGLKSVTIPNSVTSIGSYAFNGCSGLKSVTIPNSVTKIGSYAFDDCSGLEKVIVQDLAAWCGISFGTDGKYDYAPSNPLLCAHHLYSDENTEITDLIIPDTVTSIGSYAFYGCSGLKSVTIPNSVTEIGDGAFGCSGLRSIVSLIQEPSDIDSKAFVDRGWSESGVWYTDYDIYYNRTLYVPEGTADKYRAKEGWKEFYNIVDGIPSSIATPNNEESNATETERYTINGKRIITPQRGINVVKMSDGTVKKVLVK